MENEVNECNEVNEMEFGSDNRIIQDTKEYRFQHPYEITINDAYVKQVLMDPHGGYILHIDISETDAQRTLSKFITEVAHKVGIIKDININNIALPLNFDTIKLSKHYASIVQQQPHVLHGSHVDVTIEWSAFKVQGNDMIVNLQLTELAVTVGLSSPDIDLLSIVKKTAPKSIAHADAPDLFNEKCQQLNVSYVIENEA